MLTRHEKAGDDTAQLMQDIGAKARAAARPLAIASAGQQARRAGRHGRGDPARRGRNPRGQRERPRNGEEGKLGAAFMDRLKLTPSAHSRHGRRHRAHRRARRSGRRGDRRMGPAERPAYRARAHAARRHRRHLREPAQRHGRRRRALPQGRQSGDPARRLGFAEFLAGDPRLPGRGAAGQPGCPRMRSSWCRPPTAPPSARC